jgi:hypothetical protein
MRTALFSTTILALALCVSCSDTTEAGHSPYSIPRDRAELVKQYYREVVWRLPEKRYEFLFLLDGPTFIAKHREEMLKTLEVVETVEADTLAACFVRYSVGGSIYRQVQWLHRIDGDWRVSQKSYFSSLADDPFNDGNPDRAKNLLKRVVQWEKDSAPIWW